MPDTALTSLGRYTLQAELGHGGFATVYRAIDTALEREVALKVLKPGWTDDVRAVERFMREAKQVSRLKHPNIVTIYDVGQAEGRLFIAMELVPGRSLQQIIAEDGALPWARVLAILEQSAAALDYAHKQGLVHRDIKPANIILDESDPNLVRAMLTDFGLVRGAEQASLSTGTTGGLIGTPEYIAPEIWNGKAATKASDIYALGCVVFYLLTGQVLFSATTPMAVLMRHVAGPVFPAQWPSGVPASAEAVLRRALAKEPNERPASAMEFVSALREREPRVTAEQKVKSTRQAELDAVQPKAREEQERLRQIEVAAQVAADKAKREWDSEQAERQRQASEAAALEKARREAAERERGRQPVEQESRRRITESSQPVVGRPAVKGKSNRRWVFAAGGLVALVIAVMALANIKPPPSTPTAAPAATKYVPTQPPRPTDVPKPTTAPAATMNVSTQPPRPTDVPKPTTAPIRPTAAPNAFTTNPPVADGIVSNGEWDTVLSAANLSHGRVFYMNDNTNLYLLVDLTGDTVDDPPLSSSPWGDYFWLSFDVNKNRAIDPDLDLQYGFTIQNGGYNFGVQYYKGPGSWTGNQATISRMSAGFGPSFDSATPHRIWEFALRLREIQAAPGEQVRFGLKTSSQTPSFTDDTPPNFYQDFSSLIEVTLGSQ